MRRVLLDQNIPAPLARLLAGHEEAHASAMARGRLTNGDLLAAAQRNGFDIMVTADRGILYQQNHARRTIALVMRDDSNWPIVRDNHAAIARAVAEVEPAGLKLVTLHRLGGRRRNRPYVPDR